MLPVNVVIIIIIINNTVAFYGPWLIQGSFSLRVYFEQVYSSLFIIPKVLICFRSWPISLVFWRPTILLSVAFFLQKATESGGT